MPNDIPSPEASSQEALAASPGSAYRHENGEVVCAACGYECEWEQCYAGCEDGYFDGYEEDPLWYDVGELMPCNECGGRGGSFWCDNRECKTGEIVRLIKARTGMTH